MVGTLDRKHALLWVSLFTIVTIGVFVRVPGVLWMKDAAPSANHSIHPDVPKLIRVANNFGHRPGMDGYVVGMSTHLYLVRKLLHPIFGDRLDLAILIRIISLSYGIFTIILISMIARSWRFPNNVALLGSALLAIAPLHVINSHFGTPNASATFYFYLSLFAGWGYVKTRHSLLFVLFVALIAASIAMKFFISLLAPFFIVLWLHTKGSRVEKIVTAVLVAAGSFSVFSFFNYTPWHFIELIKMIAFDNVHITGGHNAAKQIGLYLWDTISALGLATWIFFVIGLIYFIAGFSRNVTAELKLGSWRLFAEKVIKSPGMIFISAFVAHSVLLISAEIHGIRHLLVFIPIACLISANGLWKMVLTFKCSRVITAIILCLLISYQCYTVINLGRMYTGDLRGKMAGWINTSVKNEEKVGTFSDYSWVKGVTRLSADESNTEVHKLDYFVTCDLEYSRYFLNTNANKIFHAFGGQDRLDFYHNLFANKLEYDVVFDAVWQPIGLEQWLQEKNIISELGTFTPKRCLILKRILSSNEKY